MTVEPGGKDASAKEPLHKEPLHKEPLHEELKRYVRFSDDDARLLAGARAAVAPSFRRVAEEFYDRIREHEDAHAVFTSEEQIARLQRSLVVWLERVFGGTYDAAYFAKTEQIGAVHVRVGLPQRYVVTAMTLIRSSLTALLPDPKVQDALARFLDVELAIMLESYRTDALARLERASRTEAERTDEIAKIAPFAIVGLDAAGNVLSFNPAAEALTGWADDEIRGRRLVDVVVPEDARKETSVVLARERRFEMPLLTRSGKLRRTEWRTAAHGDEVVAFGADVTDELEQRVHEERTSRLESAGNLVAGLAHAVRNPLNGAGLHLALVERSAAKAGATETLDAVRVAGAELRRIGTLVTDFLEFARPRPIVVAPIDARRICERAIEATRADADANHVSLTADLPSQPLSLDADGARLEQVIGHLVENAIDALRTTGGAIVVRARREPRHVRIEVEDSGPGLPAPDAPIFDAFYSTKPEGTGLGLAIVHRVVAEHDGEVDVESQPGCTRFRLRLPLTREAMKT